MCFKLQRAYETVSDPEQRRVYDTVWESIRDRLWAQQDAEKRQAEAAERKRAAEQKRTATREKAAERKRAAERDQAEAAKAEAERKRAAEERMNRQVEETARQERLRFLQSRRKGYEIDIMEASRVVQQKKDELLKEENELKTLETAMQEVDDMIAAHRNPEEKEEAEAQAAELREQVRKEQEARTEQEQERCEEPWRAPWEESREERQKRWDAVMDEMFGRSRRPNLQPELGKRKRHEKQESEHRWRERKTRGWKGTRGAKPRIQANNSHDIETTGCGSDSKATTCRHNKSWVRAEGRHRCSNCGIVQNRFTSKRPGRSVVACADCLPWKRTSHGPFQVDIFHRRRKQIITLMHPILAFLSHSGISSSQPMRSLMMNNEIRISHGLRWPILHFLPRPMFSCSAVKLYLPMNDGISGTTLRLVSSACLSR